jgi:hypothetical protein
MKKRSFFEMMDYRSASKTLNMHAYKRSNTALRAVHMRYKESERVIGMPHYKAHISALPMPIIRKLNNMADKIIAHVERGYYTY